MTDAYPITRPNTPVPRTDIASSEFTTRLQSSLEVLLTVQADREAKYGRQIAEKWPISRTPPEVVCEHAARTRGVDTPTDDTTLSNSGNGNFNSGQFTSGSFGSVLPNSSPDSISTYASLRRITLAQ